MGKIVSQEKRGIDVHESHWHISTWLFWGALIVGCIWLFARGRKR